ncbi:MAG: hypothetical protein V2A58_17305 [Planctomycetota bacterium]
MSDQTPELLVLFDLPAGSLAEEIARDEALLDEIEGGRAGALLRFWELPRFGVAVGKGEALEDCVKMPEVLGDRLEIIRRPSAGGSVLIGPGNLNIVLAATHGAGGRDIHRAYRTLQEAVALALRAFDVPAAFIPPGDIALGGRKISGIAQCSRRRGYLVHSTLLVSMDLSLIGRYLPHPAREPAYRAGRAHLDFLTTLRAAGFPIDVSDLRHKIAETLAESLEAKGLRRERAPAGVVMRADELVALRYGLASWTREKIDHVSRRRTT